MARPKKVDRHSACTVCGVVVAHRARVTCSAMCSKEHSYRGKLQAECVRRLGRLLCVLSGATAPRRLSTRPPRETFIDRMKAMNAWLVSIGKRPQSVGKLGPGLFLMHCPQCRELCLELVVSKRRGECGACRHTLNW